MRRLPGQNADRRGSGRRIGGLRASIASSGPPSDGLRDEHTERLHDWLGDGDELTRVVDAPGVTHLRVRVKA